MPRMLRHVAEINLKTTILGHPIDFSVCVAPTSMHALAHQEAEIATAKGRFTLIGKLGNVVSLEQWYV